VKLPEETVRRTARTSEPVQDIDTGSVHKGPEEGIALCLSGGGYRAMLFHLGSLWRLYEVGILKDVKRISSVSGGSITSAVLGLNWRSLRFDASKIQEDFAATVVDPVRRLASETIDAESIISGILLPGTISEKIAGEYRKFLYGDSTLQDLPDEPRFVINATNVQSGALWRFMKPYMRDWRVGEIKKPQTPLAVAVAASSAFPPVLSPATMRVNPDDFTPGSGAELQRDPYTRKVFLTDGGVYDNLGLETAWKRYKTILVSDAGGRMEPEEEPKGDWARHSYRVLSLIDNQVRSLRKRQVIGSYIDGTREGAYWGIRSNIEHYELADALACPIAATTRLAEIPTRLKRLPAVTQEKLINWGYALCDAALRKHVDASVPPPRGFPYERAAV